jgi:Xaa-Pro aminopeptidase
MTFDLVAYARGLPLDHLCVRMPAAEYAGRIERTRRMLRERGLDIGVAYGTESMPGDTGWLTGYDPQIESTMVVVGQADAFILGGPSFARYGGEMSAVAEYRLCRELSIDEDYPTLTLAPLADLLREAAGGPVLRVGLLTADDLLSHSLRRLIAETTSADLIDATDFLSDARYHKSDAELRMAAVATRIAGWAMEAAVRSARPGARELEVAAAAEYVMRYAGADRLGYLTIVMSGERACMVGARPSNRVIRACDIVTISVCPRWEGIAGTVGRTFVAGGRRSASQDALLAHIERAFELARERIGPGLPAREVDAAGRAYLNAHGLFPLYGLVHGGGWTECMEGTGGADPHSTYDFPAGVQMMLDVGVFDQPVLDLPTEQVGVRVEDTFCIDGAGVTRQLSGAPIRLDEWAAE